jgi:HK97 family phage major capsid protein
VPTCYIQVREAVWYDGHTSSSDSTSGSPNGDSEGPFLWHLSVIGGRPATFLGHPIYADDEMGTLDGTGDVIAIFGDLRRGYRILDGKSFGIQRLSDPYAAADLVSFKVHATVGGYPIRPSNKALVPLKGQP